MAVGRTNTGGGGGKIKSIIAVTYPEGSTCTCANGTKMLTAPDKSGNTFFNVTPGTWTVSATDGTYTDSQSVTIAEGRSVSVTLQYDLILYESGNEYTENTGGWESKRYCTLTNTLTALHAIPTAQYSANAGVFATKQKINLAYYSTLHYHAKNNCAENSYLQVAVWATIPASGEPIAASAAHVAFSANEEKEGAIDVSKLTGEYYVGGVVLKGDKVTGDGYIYSMRLER